MTEQPDTDRRERYKTAMHNVRMLRDAKNQDRQADAVMAVADQEQQEMADASVRFTAVARHQSAIDALRNAAEEMRVGVASCQIPPDVRPAIAAWLCRLAKQRVDLARRTLADRLHTELAAAARPDNTGAPQSCPPGCVACATDESHDPTPRPDNTTGA